MVQAYLHRNSSAALVVQAVQTTVLTEEKVRKKVRNRRTSNRFPIVLLLKLPPSVLA